MVEKCTRLGVRDR